MWRAICLGGGMFGAFVLFGVAPLRAQNPGQADLDKATELQVAVQSLADLEEVAKLCESALKKGLDEGNRKFAEQTAVFHAVPARHAVVCPDLRCWGSRSPLADPAEDGPPRSGAGHRNRTATGRSTPVDRPVARLARRGPERAAKAAAAAVQALRRRQERSKRPPLSCGPNSAKKRPNA